MDPRVSVAFQSDKTAQDYAELAAAAEAYGFGTISVFGDLMFQPPLFPLLVMAQHTSRVRLGFAGLNPTTLHPVEMAGQVATLDLLSLGRAYLGVVAGSWMDKIGLRHRRPATAVQESAEMVASLLSGDASGFSGSVFSLAPGTMLNYQPHRPRVPLLIGGWGPRMLAIAGELADEVKIGGSANSAMVAVARERVSVGAGRVGRAVDDIGIVLGAVTVVDEDGARARARARAEVALYLPVVAALDPTTTVDPELIDRVGALVQTGSRRDAGALIPDEVLAKFAFAGTPEQVAEQARGILDAGAARVEFGTPHGLTDAGGLHLLGRRVLPLLQG